MTGYILDLRTKSLIAGVREADFWEMTVGETVRAIEAYNERRKDEAFFAYSNAMATGLFIGSIFTSNAPPTLSDIYPDLFPPEEEKEAEEEKRMADSAANFINFANAFNRKFGNGDNRRTESENNG